jgi:hypothetical protein
MELMIAFGLSPHGRKTWEAWRLENLSAGIGFYAKCLFFDKQLRRRFVASFRSIRLHSWRGWLVILVAAVNFRCAIFFRCGPFATT